MHNGHWLFCSIQRSQFYDRITFTNFARQTASGSPLNIIEYCSYEWAYSHWRYILNDIQSITKQSFYKLKNISDILNINFYTRTIASPTFTASLGGCYVLCIQSAESAIPFAWSELGGVSCLARRMRDRSACRSTPSWDCPGRRSTTCETHLSEQDHHDQDDFNNNNTCEYGVLI